jgi:hypothetical protein
MNKKGVFFVLLFFLLTGICVFAQSTQSDQDLKREITRYIERLNFENNFQKVTLSESLFPKSFGIIFIYPIQPNDRDMISRVRQRLNYGVGSDLFPKQNPGDDYTSIKHILYIDLSEGIIILWDTQGI